MSFFPSIIKSIQRGTITLTLVASNTGALGTAVDPAYSVVRLLGGEGNDARRVSSLARVRLTGASQVTAYVAASSGSAITVAYEVVEYYPIFMLRPVQEGVISMADAGSTTGTASVTAPTGKGELLSNGSSGGATLTNTDATGGIVARVSLSGTTITATRAVTANDCDTGWTLIDWRG